MLFLSPADDAIIYISKTIISYLAMMVADADALIIAWKYAFGFQRLLCINVVCELGRKKETTLFISLDFCRPSHYNITNPKLDCNFVGTTNGLNYFIISR